MSACRQRCIQLSGLPSMTYVAPVHAVIDDIRKTGDSCGGEVTCIVRHCPKGLGAPVFGKLEAELAGALMSLPASKVS